MIGAKIYYGSRWLFWNVAHAALAVNWLVYHQAYAGNILRFLMAFTLICQVAVIAAFDSASVSDRTKATKHLVFSESFYRNCNYLADLTLVLTLAAFGLFFWAAIGAMSLVLTGATIGKYYDFIAEMKGEAQPKPRECGCQHCN